MKTSIELPDDLFDLAQSVAASRGITFETLIIEGLLHVSNRASSMKIEVRTKGMNHLVASLKATNSEAMTPLKRRAIYMR